MKGYLARLSSMERRFVVAVMVVIVLVINVLFIWPRFKDWKQAEDRLAAARATLELYRKEIANEKKYLTEVRRLESETAAVPPEDQEIEFARSITTEAARSGVVIQVNNRQNAPTNQFFLERAQSLSVLADEAQLVNFLYNLGAGNSLIRVRDLTIRPELPARQKLNASIKLVASYQKKAPTRATVRPVGVNTPSAKSATSTAKSP